MSPRLSVDLAHDRPAEDTVEAHTWLRLWASGDAEQLHWFVEGQALHLALVGQDTEAVLTTSLGETGAEIPLGPTWLRVGTLIERWGQLDLLPVADVLNGRDGRLGPLAPAAFQRVPAPMARLQAPWAWGQAELVWLPVSASSRASLAGTDWSLVRQDMIAAQLAEAQTWEGDALTTSSLQGALSVLEAALSDVDPWTRWTLSEVPRTAGMPAALGLGSDVAARVELYGPGMSMAVLGGVIRSRQVVPVVSPALVTYLQEERLPGYSELEALQAELEAPVALLAPRSALAGLELSGLVGPVGLRGEGVYTHAAAVPQPWLQGTTSPELAVGAGADYTQGRWGAVVEGSWRRLLDAPAETFLVAPSWWRVGGGVQGRLVRERLLVQVGGLVDLSYQEWSLQPTVQWRASDALEVGVGGLVLGGWSGRTAPQTLPEALVFAGGPLGYWGDNDCLTASLTWIR